MNKTQSELENRLSGHIDKLPGSERALAELLLKFPGVAAVYSATELADEAQVSKAAVTRLVHRLGYKDFREMREEVRNARAAGHPLFLSLPESPSQTPGRGLQAHLEQDILSLRSTIESIQPDLLNEAARAAARARRVMVVGLRNSHFFAAYMRHQLTLVRDSVDLVPMPGQIVMEEVANLDSKDLVIAIGLRRRPATLKKVLQWLRGEEVPVILFCDRFAGTTASLATWAFPCETRGVSTFDSYVGVMSLLTHFCEKVVSVRRDAGRDRLKRIEAHLSEADEFEDEIF